MNKAVEAREVKQDIETLMMFSILSRSKGNTNKFIEAVKEQIESGGQVMLPNTDISMARKYWKLLKNKGCECSFNPVYSKSFIANPDPKLEGHIFFKPT